LTEIIPVTLAGLELSLAQGGVPANTNLRAETLRRGEEKRMAEKDSTDEYGPGCGCYSRKHQIIASIVPFR
jgi:hypothetical protein